MTQCTGVPAEEMADRYLAGGLTETESEQFENHYFSCDSCHEHLLVLQEIRDGMVHQPMIVPAPAPEPVARPKGLTGRLLSFPVPVAVLGSIAATLVFGAVLVSVQRAGFFHLNHGGTSTARVMQPVTAPNSAPPTASNASKETAQASGGNDLIAQNEKFASLADLRTPGYEQPQLRGESSSDGGHQAFATGMAAYASGDCRAALGSLQNVPLTAADGVAAQLYLGLCQLQEREPGRAQVSFAKVIAAGDSPQLESAEYFLAQAKLLRGDAKGATSWLNRTIALQGDYEERARRQRTLLADAEKASH